VSTSRCIRLCVKSYICLYICYCFLPFSFDALEMHHLKTD